MTMERMTVTHFDFEAGEILNIDKPMRLTSFGVVERIRRWTGCRKVGHAGTLDPMATGVLLVCTGLATKRVSTLMLFEKVYEGTIELGTTTDTDDSEGKVINRSTVNPFPEDEIKSVLAQFKGVIDQIPPMYSAIKKNGKRLYQLARKGVIVQRDPRRVEIYEIDLLSYKRPYIQVRIRCSKGTYIRALARDIGEKLGSGGYLKNLRRLRVGPYEADKAFGLTMLRDLLTIQNGSLSKN